MLLTSIVAMAMAAQASPQATESGVAYDAVSQGRDAEAIARIDEGAARDASDPARLINLGIAYARQGEEAKARDLFETAAGSDNRVELETAKGEFKDSRMLARKAIKMLDKGEFQAERMTMR